MILKNAIKIILLLFLTVHTDKVSFAQYSNIDASKLVPRAEISFSPRTGSFVEGSTFEVPILLNTKGNSINSIELKIIFDKDKLSIIKPSNGSSIIGVWVEPPKYDNTKGTASYVGVVPNGIVTASGQIGSITFKALKTGLASVRIGNESTLLLNNGLGTEVTFDSIKANYSIIPKAPEGLNVFSETHPFQGDWYNNNNPVISWDGGASFDGYSFELDNKPSTIPDNIIDSTETTRSYENLSDGLWYFHIKASKNGVWGSTTHFLIKLDTVPPADFKPESNYVVASIALVERTLISFFTTDNLSGVDHYEVGVIDKSQPLTESPVFIETESPYQVPLKAGSNLRVVVRAIDKAHNVRDVSVDVKPPILITKFIKQYIVYILLAIILIGLAALIMHYVFGHHIIRHIKEFKKLLNEENENKNETKESMNSYTETPIKPDQNNHQNEIIIVKKDSNL
jgi:hypothetical protein